MSRTRYLHTLIAIGAGCLALLVLLLASETASPASGGGGSALTPRDTAARDCPDAIRGLRFYRHWTAEWHSRRGAAPTPAAGAAPSAALPRRRSCTVVRRAALAARTRARAARRAYVRWTVRMRDPRAAICHVFGRHCAEALRVSSCETGGTYDVWARNGQYLGLFQMGLYARERYGHGWTPLVQARCAYAYFVSSGRDWSPWSCQP